MLRNQINSQNDLGFIVARLDAWKVEANGDPLIGLTLALINGVGNEKSPTNSEANNKLNEINAELKVILKKLACSIKGIRASVLGAVIGSAAETAIPGSAYFAASTGAATAEIASSIFNKLSEDTIDAQFKYESLREAFEVQIKKLVDVQRTIKAGGGCKLLILVDELDRCRPDYAISVFERIKHFFDIPGVVFLVAYDSEYLISAAQTVYGQNFSADAYFRKFIDYEIRLPQPEPRDIASFIWSSLELGSLSGMNNQRELVQEAWNAVVSLMQVFPRISIRDWFQICVKIKLLIIVNWREHKAVTLMMIYILIGRYAFDRVAGAGLSPETVSMIINGVIERSNNFDNLENANHNDWLFVVSKIGDLSYSRIQTILSNDGYFKPYDQGQLMPIITSISNYAKNNISFNAYTCNHLVNNHVLA